MGLSPISPAERLKAQLQSPDCLTVALGVWDGMQNHAMIRGSYTIQFI